MSKQPRLPKSRSKKLFQSQSTRVRLNSGQSTTYNSVPAQASDTEDSDLDQTYDTVTSFAQIFNQGTSSPQQGSKGKKKPTEEIELQKKPSPVLAPLPRLTQDEYKFFKTVESGDLEGVEGFLQLGNMDLNKTDRSGYTVLHIAVRRQDEEMVKLLLGQEGINLYDTILHAVREDNMEITKLLVEHHDNTLQTTNSQQPQPSTSNMSQDVVCMRIPSTGAGGTGTGAGVQTFPSSRNSPIMSSVKLTVLQKKASQTSSKSHKSSTSSDIRQKEEIPFDSEFHDVITPLMMAAQVGSTPLIDFFYQRGERLENEQFPHNSKCKCDICSKLVGDQDMTRAFERLHLFKSITRPEYICYVSRKEKRDPINYAIDKIIKLRELCARDVVYDKQYEEPLECLEDFITKMVDLCRTTVETEVFFSPKDPSEKELLPHQYPRLWYAVGLDLKKFVAAQNTQNLVYKTWATDEWPEWDTFDAWKLVQAMIVPRLIILTPVLCLLASIKTKPCLQFYAPVSRFINYLVCYTIFIALICFQVLYPYQRCNHQIHDKDCKERGPPWMMTEIPIALFVAGFYLSMLKRQSVSWFWRMKWNWFEMLMLLSFTLTFVYWIQAWIWTKLPENLYLFNTTERVMWPHDSPEILGDCFLAISVMFALGRVLRFVQVFPTIGPIQIGLGRQIVDFMSMTTILGVVVAAAASGFVGNLGLLAIYVPYKGFKGINSDGKRDIQDSTFTDLEKTFENLFWYLFGHGSSMSPASLLQWDVGADANGTVIKNTHDLTQYMGKTLYFLYHLMGSMMMFSMLSGYFSNTLTEVQDNVDMFWKYNRTEFYLTFMKDTLLPPPFNLIPTVKVLGGLISCKYLKLIGKKNDPKLACSLRKCCYVTQGKKRSRWSQLMKGYRKLIVELMFRYQNYKDEADEAEKATKDDVQEIGEELDELISLVTKMKKGSKEDVAGDGRGDGPPSPPPGGGVQGTVSEARGLSRWGTTRDVVQSRGPVYLKNKSSKKLPAPSKSAQPVSASTPKSQVKASRSKPTTNKASDNNNNLSQKGTTVASSSKGTKSSSKSPRTPPNERQMAYDYDMTDLMTPQRSAKVLDNTGTSKRFDNQDGKAKTQPSVVTIKSKPKQQPKESKSQAVSSSGLPTTSSSKTKQVDSKGQPVHQTISAPPVLPSTPVSKAKQVESKGQAVNQAISAPLVLPSTPVSKTKQSERKIEIPPSPPMPDWKIRPLQKVSKSQTTVPLPPPPPLPRPLSTAVEDTTTAGTTTDSSK